MAAKDFNRGYPRNGQWVKWNGKVGINTGAVPFGAGIRFRIGLVDEAGFRSTEYVEVGVEELVPVTARADVPAKRLATMDPKWEPQP